MQADPPTPPRLQFLDGIRGLAALYVCTHHAYLEIYDHGKSRSLPGWAELGGLFLHGHEAVDLFIVLSGFCLMLPSVRTGMLRGGLAAFASRRAWRILPPYYASILLTLAVITAVPALGSPTGYRWDVLLPAGTAGVLASHALLIHNLSASWCSKITGTAWSVATEAQIYALFPLLLLCWRRLGDAATIAAGLGIGVLATAAFSDFRLAGWCPWYLGLFGMGMWAASTPIGAPASWRGAAVAAIAGGAGLLVIWLSGLHSPRPGGFLWLLFRPPMAGYSWYHDAGWGILSAALLVGCRWLNGRPRAWFNPLTPLESPACVLLGLFSYSLYLVHYPIISGFHLAIHRAGIAIDPVSELIVMLGVGVPSALGLSFLFYLAFERRGSGGDPPIRNDAVPVLGMPGPLPSIAPDPEHPHDRPAPRQHRPLSR